MFSTFVVLIVTTHICASQNFGTLIYITRVQCLKVCPTSDSIFQVNGTSTPHRTFEYWNGYATITEDFLIDKLMYLMHKCGEGFYPCEKFINITTNGKDIKQFLEAKKQLWSPIWESINPKPNLPMFRKGTYTITNATIDVPAIASAIPEFDKYFWKIQIDGYTKSKAKHFCYYFQFYIVKHIIRNRQKTPKRQ